MTIYPHWCQTPNCARRAMSKDYYCPECLDDQQAERKVFTLRRLRVTQALESAGVDPDELLAWIRGELG
jgi:hypothetical protein